MKFLDVSLPLSGAVPTYPRNPTFDLAPVQRIAAGDSSNVSRLTLGTHTGTHIDAPRHFLEEGAAVDQIPLELLIGRSRVIEVQSRRGIGPEHFSGLDLR